MTKNKPMDAMTKVVELLTPLPSEERKRIIHAAMVLLGETQTSVTPAALDRDGALTDDSEPVSLPARARAWMKQYGITADDLQQVFHLVGEGVEIIAPHIPGKHKKEQTYSAYILIGIGQLLATGNASFEDKAARALCESSGCYDSGNHSTYIKDKGNEFTGTKDRGWALTAPGLKRGAEIIKELVHD